MKHILAVLTPDLIALGALIGASLQFIPALAGLLAVVYYSFVIYDRIKYGPELEQRTFWHRRQDKENRTDLANRIEEEDK